MKSLEPTTNLQKIERADQYVKDYHGEAISKIQTVK